LTTLSLRSVTATASTSATATASFDEFFVILDGSETEKFCSFTLADSVQLTSIEILSQSSGHLRVLILRLFNFATNLFFFLSHFVLFEETLGLGLLGCEIVIKSKTDFFFFDYWFGCFSWFSFSSFDGSISCFLFASCYVFVGLWN
jgi:hypothetical protein